VLDAVCGCLKDVLKLFVNQLSNNSKNFFSCSCCCPKGERADHENELMPLVRTNTGQRFVQPNPGTLSHSNTLRRSEIMDKKVGAASTYSQISSSSHGTIASHGETKKKKKGIVKFVESMESKVGINPKI